MRDSHYYIERFQNSAARVSMLTCTTIFTLPLDLNQVPLPSAFCLLSFDVTDGQLTCCTQAELTSTAKWPSKSAFQRQTIRNWMGRGEASLGVKQSILYSTTLAAEQRSFEGV